MAERPLVGSWIRHLLSGRLGEVTIDDHSYLPFKVLFHDGGFPGADWFRECDVERAPAPRTSPAPASTQQPAPARPPASPAATNTEARPEDTTDNDAEFPAARGAQPEALEQEESLGERDVEVQAVSSEWAAGAEVPGMDSSDDEEAEENKRSRHATCCYVQRERRLSARSEALVLAQTLGDKDVELVTQSTEWAAIETSDGEEDANDDVLTSCAEQSYRAREKRITACQEAMNQGLAIGDKDVEVVAQSAEWDESESDEDDVDFDAHAKDTFDARERRISVGSQVLQQQTALGDVDVEIKAQDTEWAAIETSDDEHDAAALERHASDTFRARERRLTAGKEALEVLPVASD